MPMTLWQEYRWLCRLGINPFHAVHIIARRTWFLWRVKRLQSKPRDGYESGLE